MLRNLLFGQYNYKKTLVHSLDPRLKLSYVIALSILIFVINEFAKILIFSFFILIIALLSKLNAKSLIKNVRPFLFILIFIFLMYLIFSRNKLIQGIIAIWSFLMLIVISFILAYTTPISGLTTAIERLIKPLKILNLNPRNIAVMISITIKFIPVMFINLERLEQAMLSRLVNFRKLKNVRLLLLVLLEKMFKSASNLSDAMQARLYNENASGYKTLEFSKYDYISIVFILIFILVTY